MAHGFDLTKPAFVTVRAYYLNSMGVKGKNDRRIFDDAIFVVAPDVYAAYPFNVDPSIYRKGRGFGAEKGVASVKAPQKLRFERGLHRGKYMALRQPEDFPFVVIRDGDPPYEHKGYHAINMHYAEGNTTSSLGCLTMPKEMFLKEFRPLVYGLMDRYKMPYIEGLLIENTPETNR